MSKRVEAQDRIKNSISDTLASLTTSDQLQVLTDLFNHVSKLIDQGVLDYVELVAQLRRKQEREEALKEYIEVIVEALKDSPNLKRDIKTLREDLMQLMSRAEEPKVNNHSPVDKEQLHKYKETVKKIIDEQ